MTAPLVAVIHTTPASMAPTAAALSAAMPPVRVWNLIDDRLGSDADEAGSITPALRDRMLTLIRHAVTGGADAVLVACSMYGEVAPDAERTLAVPVFSSDGDMMAAMADHSPRRVAVLASLRAATADTTKRLREALAAGGVEVVPAYCDGAVDAASSGDPARMVDVLVSGIDTAGGSFDMLCIAQYSLSPVTDELAVKTGLPVVSPPRFAAQAIARRLEVS